MDEKIPNAGGSGGGPETIDHSSTYDGTYRVSANQVQFLSRPPLPPASPGPNNISLLASGMGTDGKVDVRGSQGVRITSGPPLLPPATSDSTNGVEVIASEAQNVTIQRGLIEGVDQQIQMSPGSIVIDGGVGTITIKSLTQITLQVAGGLSSITLGPQGVTIQGILIQIN
jgi:hypothetical protein